MAQILKSQLKKKKNNISMERRNLSQSKFWLNIYSWAVTAFVPVSIFISWYINALYTTPL